MLIYNSITIQHVFTISRDILKLPIKIEGTYINMQTYSLMAAQNITAVTPSKRWIHFLLSFLWPPTSYNLYTSPLFLLSPTGLGRPPFIFIRFNTIVIRFAINLFSEPSQINRWIKQISKISWNFLNYLQILQTVRILLPELYPIHKTWVFFYENFRILIYLYALRQTN